MDPVKLEGVIDSITDVDDEVQLIQVRQVASLYIGRVVFHAPYGQYCIGQKVSITIAD